MTSTAASDISVSDFFIPKHRTRKDELVRT